MVDFISSANARPRIARPGEDLGLPVQSAAVGTAGGSVGGAVGTAAGASAAGNMRLAAASGDTLALSAAATALPPELSGGPPIDLELVTKIKAAIAEGKYPIDLDKITESLFQDFVKMMA